MDSTKHKAAQSEASAPRKNAAITSHSFKKGAAAVAIVLVAALIPCVAILQNGALNSARGNPDDIPAPAAQPWGRLEYTPIVIAPPLEFVSHPSLDYYSEDITWHFPEIGPTELSILFQTIGLSAPLSEKLISMAEPNEAIGGVSIHPPRQFVLNLCSKDRSTLYIALADYAQNFHQHNPFRFRGNSPDEWFAGSAVSPATRKLVDPLIYRRGEFMYFADVRNIGYLPSRTERSNLFKALLRDATFIAHLKISPDSDLEALVKYWGRGGRTNEVRPILEALMQRGGEQAINITHLLPALARRKLYTYPKHSYSDMATHSRDCHWTSLNFFNEVPDDSLSTRDGRTVAGALRSDYYRIGGNLRLGDVVFILNSRQVTIHSAVYIADDVFFHRCGSQSSAPWALARRKDLEAYYPSHQKYEIRYFRHNSL